jgi:hypothetical protein
MKKQVIAPKSYASEEEIAAYERLLDLLQQSPIPPREFLANIGLYLNRSLLSRICFLQNLYLKILNVHGVVVEFGVRWGQNMALFSTFRNMYEPHNYSRKIIGFDTFEGFLQISPQDGKGDEIKVGNLDVTENYEDYLENLLLAHDKLAPRGHIKKFELIKGDVNSTLPHYLELHPETIISLVYFDLDLYQPTRFCLEKIREHMTRGAIIGFDELAHPDCPGETLALKEVLGLSRYSIQRDSISNDYSYIVFE